MRNKAFSSLAICLAFGGLVSLAACEDTLEPNLGNPDATATSDAGGDAARGDGGGDAKATDSSSDVASVDVSATDASQPDTAPADGATSTDAATLDAPVDANQGSI